MQIHSLWSHTVQNKYVLAAFSHAYDGKLETFSFEKLCYNGGCGCTSPLCQCEGHPHNIQEGNRGVEDIHEVAYMMFAKQHMGSAVLSAFCRLEKYVWAFCFQMFLVKYIMMYNL